MFAGRLGSTRILAGSLAGLVVATIVFVAWPGLDLAVAGLFALGAGRFAGQTGGWDAVRRVSYWAPSGLFVLAVVLYALRRFARPTLPAPSGAGVLFLALSLALGPWLSVNGVLKTVSHRPRPYQTHAFGGDEDYRPFWRFDGACRRNCSFVSGEVSASVWTVAPALLVPPPARALAVLAALAFGAATGALRVAEGGHYLSDAVFAALLTWLVILGCWRLVARISPAA